jgi:hypothetical protein
MIDDRDIWAAALLLVKRYGDDAMLEGVAARRSAARRGRHIRCGDAALHPERYRAAAS